MNIVITGSSKGIGKALANRCLIEGDRVLISSRSQENVNTTVEEFQLKYPKENVFGTTCDVSNANDVDALVNLAKEKFGKINIWINNAGTNGFDRNNLVDMKVSSIKAVVETNILGTLLCCRAVLKVMLEQGSGHIFNMEGMGSNGMTMPMMLCYAMSKRAVPMIKKALVLETQGKNVGIHDISPGMVQTDLILKNLPPQMRGFIDKMANPPDVVADYLVPRIRSVEGTDKLIQYPRPVGMGRPSGMGGNSAGGGHPGMGGGRSPHP